MNSPIGSGGPAQPILTPLAGRRRFSSVRLNRLPAAAAPAAVTLLGAVALVVAMGAWLREDAIEQAAAPVELVEEAAAGAPLAKASASEAVKTASVVPEAEAPVEEPVSEAVDLAEAIVDEAAPKAAELADPDAPAFGDEPKLELAEASAQEPMSRDEIGPDPEVAADVTVADTANDLLGREAGSSTAAAFSSVAAANPDPGLTAAIPPASPGALEPDVAIADSEEEIAALEARQSQEVAQDLAAAAPDDASSEPVEDDGSMRAAVATKWVNMRAGPADEAEVLVVVPALAEIEAEEDCEWCAVTYDGQSGFIYKSFISYEDKTEAAEAVDG